MNETISLDTPQSRVINGKREFFFYCIVSPGKHEEKRIIHEDGDGYNSIEEALASLPLSKLKTKDDMQRAVARDFGLGLGKVYEDFGVVAYTGSYYTIRPLAWYLHGDQKKYIKHPQIELMVQRYE